MNFNYHIVDRVNGIAVCSAKEIPDTYKREIAEQGGELAKLTFYFDKQQDLVVLNEDNKAFDFYKEIVLSMMEYTDEKLLCVYDELPVDTRTKFKNLFTILIAVKRYRVLKTSKSCVKG